MGSGDEAAKTDELEVEEEKKHQPEKIEGEKDNGSEESEARSDGDTDAIDRIVGAYLAGESDSRQRPPGGWSGRLTVRPLRR